MLIGATAIKDHAKYHTPQAQVDFLGDPGVASKTVLLQPTGSLGKIPNMMPHGLNAVLVRSPGLACSLASGPAPRHASTTEYAVAVYRGGCPFETKALVAG